MNIFVGKGLDYLNIVLILCSAALAYAIPFELLLLAYAFLGPAHYLTEISWLHDRKYFAPGSKWLILSGALMLTTFAILFAGGAFLVLALAGACALVFAVRPSRRLVVFGVCLLIGGAVYALGYGVGVAIFLPTVVHVFVFTMAFMLEGALRSKSVPGFVAVGVLLGAAAMFFIHPPSIADGALSELAARHGYYFDSVRTALLSLLGIPREWSVWVGASGFLSFVYLYHYLNWFSKTKLIGWHTVSRARFFTIILGSIASVGLYLYSYTVGFTALIVLSLLHVVLEFPLNAAVIRSLYIRGQGWFMRAVR